MKSPVKVQARISHAQNTVRLEFRWPCLNSKGEPGEEFLGVQVAENLTAYQAFSELAKALPGELNVVLPPAPAEWLPKADEPAEEPEAAQTPEPVATVGHEEPLG